MVPRKKWGWGQGKVVKEGQIHGKRRKTKTLNGKHAIVHRYQVKIFYVKIMYY